MTAISLRIVTTVRSFPTVLFSLPTVTESNPYFMSDQVQNILRCMDLSRQGKTAEALALSAEIDKIADLRGWVDCKGKYKSYCKAVAAGIRETRKELGYDA